DVAQRRRVLQLGRGEVEQGVFELDLVALERLQGLVGPVEEAADVLQEVLGTAGVEIDDAHLLAGRHDGHVERPGDALGGAVAGAGLAGRHGGVGHEVDVRPGDAVAGGRDDDRPVHLDRKSTRLNSSHVKISYAVFCLKKKKKNNNKV